MGLNAYAQRIALQRDKQPLIGLATLMTMAYQGVDLSNLGEKLIALANQDDAEAMMDLSTLLQLKGDPITGVALQEQALSHQQVFRLEPEKVLSDIRLLVIMSPGDLMTNTPFEFLADGAGIIMEMLYVSPDLPFPKQLPEHDIAIVAICELDRNRPTLNLVDSVFLQWPRPILNRPHLISLMSRDLICQTLKSIPHLIAPKTIRMSRDVLQQKALAQESIGQFLVNNNCPIIIRPIDSHAGKGLSKIDSSEELLVYLQSRTESDFFVTRFIDYSDTKKQFKKYRIMFMKGKPYLAHMAVSEHWMVHYLNAGMSESHQKRAIEAEEMRTFDSAFAHRHAAALMAIHKTIGVDYFGIDCTETRDGRLLIFEVGSSMVVHGMDPVYQFPYKPSQMKKIYQGFRQMLMDTMEPYPNKPDLKVLSRD
ncbi:MAG: hypothetical protein KUG82_12800 [Pseudomonadales bacterium]|nr:hypothetical protein [Pseudomonadales bacterium]